MMRFIDFICNRCDRTAYLLACVAMLFAALFVCFFSIGGTILHPYVELDQGIWQIMGQGIIQGCVPYVDLYDHKGPLLFYFFALANYIGEGKTGVFVLESICLAISLYFTYRLSRLFVSGRWSLLALFVYLLWAFFTMEGGACNEEVTQPFVIVPLYYALKYLHREKEGNQISKTLIWAVGMCGGIIVMIRMNNAAMLFPFAGVLLWRLWREKSLAIMIKMLALMISAFVLPILLCVFFFAYQGAWNEFWMGCFSHNFMYAASYAGDRTPREWTIILLACAPLVALVWALWGECVHHTLSPCAVVAIAASAICGFLSSMAGCAFPHYFYISTPAVVLAFVFSVRAIGRLSRRTCIWACLLSVALMILPVIKFWPSRCYYTRVYMTYLFDEKYHKSVMKTVNLLHTIPMEDRNSVWGYLVDHRLFYNAKIIPCFRHFAFQREMMRVNPRIRKEIEDMLERDSPRYIVTKKNRCPDLIGPTLEQKYDMFAFEDDKLIIYKRRE